MQHVIRVVTPYIKELIRLKFIIGSNPALATLQLANRAMRSAYLLSSSPSVISFGMLVFAIFFSHCWYSDIFSRVVSALWFVLNVPNRHAHLILLLFLKKV